MILGVIAQSDETVSSGLLGQLDFYNGSYQWGGSSLTAADVVDQTGWIVGSSGLEVPAAQSAGAALLYSFMTAKLATLDFTAVFNVETLSGSKAEIFTVANAGDAYYVMAQVYGTSEWDVNDNDGSIDRWAQDLTNGLTVGVHKIALTRTPARLSLSVDGNAVVTDTTSSPNLPWDGFPMTHFYLGGWSSETAAAIKIRSMDLYNSVSDLALPGLSA